MNDRSLRRADLAPQALRAAERGLRDIGDALAPDAYWRQAIWKRIVAIAAGPAANIVLALVLFTALFVMTGGAATSQVKCTIAFASAALKAPNRKPRSLGAAPEKRLRQSRHIEVMRSISARTPAVMPLPG